MDKVQAKQDPINDSDDELGPDDHEPAPSAPLRTRPPNGTVINSQSRITDGADSQILIGSTKSKKRKKSSSDDELAADMRETKSFLSKPPQRLGNLTPRVESHSVSQRGAITPTKFNSSSSKDSLKIRVKDGVCQPNHLLSRFYNNTSPHGQCFLQPVEAQGGKELCAHRDDEEKAADVSDWLRIGRKITSIHYNKNSEIIKITQPQEDKIGRLMLLKFSDVTDATAVVSWAKSNLGSSIKFEDEPSKRLTRIFDNLMEAVTKAYSALRKSTVLKDSGEPQRTKSDVPRPTQTSPREANRARTLIRDRMQDFNSNTAEQAPRHSPANQPPSQPSSVRSKPRPIRELRSRQAAPDMYAIEDSPEPEVLPERWSEAERNRNWDKDWRMPLTLRRTTVDAQDVPRLDEGEYLNDNLIDFGLQYLFDQAGDKNPDLRNRIYMFNTFFYTQLRKSGKGRNINYDGVKSWTSRVDLFSYDYIIVPVNENLHWWLAIICNARKLDPSSCKAAPVAGKSRKVVENGDQDEPENSRPDGTVADISQLSIDSPSNSRPDGEDSNPDKMAVDLVGEDVEMKDASSPVQPPESTKTREIDLSPSSFPKGCSPSDFKILTLDSLGMGHTPAVTALKTYLIQELQEKKKQEANQLLGNVGMRANNIPMQDNGCDCGVFLLGYMRQFLADPDKFIHTLLRRERPDWKVDAKEQREKWRDNILIEQKKQQDQAEQANKGAK
ncbi:hypothetical protein V8F20_006317, partial [Naviculisporaceae sp. PSN 640]